MIFARYKGSGYEFTTGRVYLAVPEMNGGETVGFGSLSIVSDDGTVVKVNPDDESFEYFDEAYAVVCEPVEKEDWETGEIVVVTDATRDAGSERLYYRVKGVGLYRAEHFVLLDHTNVFPGLVVMDASTGQWKKVMRVDECLWMMVENGDAYRAPEEFRFAVAGNDILTEPLARCVMADGEPALTRGRLYRLAWTNENGTVIVADDDNVAREFMADRFVMGE